MKAQEVVEEVIYAGTFIITQLMIRMANNMSVNKQKGFNAIKCAFQSGFINVYFLIESAYYAARQFGQEQMLIDLAEEYYPYLCTCIEDIDYLGEMMGSDAATQANFAKCGETDYDQCWFAVEQSDGTYACDNCADYYLAADNSECFSCETTEDDGSGNAQCNANCTDYYLASDGSQCNSCTVAEYDSGSSQYACGTGCTDW